MRMRRRFDDQSQQADATTDAPGMGRALWIGSVLIAIGVGLGYGGEEVQAQSGGYDDYEASGGSASTTSDYHEVADGDTLYDLSGRYFGDTRQWPKLWSYNGHITNPHWIYPGDIVYLKPGQRQTQEPQSGEQQPRAESKERQTTDRNQGIRLATGGFVAEDEPPFVGRIVDSPKGGRLLAEHDTCWVGFGDQGYVQKEKDRMNDKQMKDMEEPEKEIEKKDRFAIVEPSGEITNDDNEVIGQKYLVLGSLVITDTSDEDLETAYIDQSWREIERGALLVPYDRQISVVDHQPADKDLVAKIIDSLAGTFDVAEHQYVFINKGASDGVRPGNRMYVYQKRSGLPKQWRNEEVPDEIPWQRLGRVRVIDTTENFATALITDSDRELGLGDRLEMYEGN